jgi:hypothetical protein
MMKSGGMGRLSHWVGDVEITKIPPPSNPAADWIPKPIGRVFSLPALFFFH